ncbi:hypothetical protein V5T82_05320 [Magnetovibrio sp. PR-2]|uniref:hypothetical protein n=1 Tax=Magnetovibrio sp. PR-2 TaxID=3120356 RepID=UPI002FCE1259
MAAFPPSPEAHEHISQHKKNHKTFRDVRAYAEGKFKDNMTSKELPNVIDLIPEYYIEELKGLDGEMSVFIKNA